MTELEDIKKVQEVKNLFEFWFGDSNLPYDKYFKKYLENQDGWVPIKNFFDFNKIKKLQIENPETLVKAVKLSTDLLSLNEKEDSVKRIKPMPSKEDIEKRLERTFYFKIERNDDGETKIDEELVKSEFEKFGKLNLYRFYKIGNKNKNRNDGIVEFSTSEEAENAKKSLKNFQKSTDSKNAKFSLVSLAEQERQKIDDERKKLLKNFDMNKIVLIENMPTDIDIFKLKQILTSAIQKNEKVDKTGQSNKKIKLNPKSDIKDDQNIKNKNEKIDKNEKNDKNDKNEKIDKNDKNEKINKDDKNENKDKKSIKEIVGNILKKTKNLFHCDFFDKEDKKYAIVRIDDNSELIGDDVKNGLAKEESNIRAKILSDIKEAEEMWIQSMEEFHKSLKNRKRFKKKRKRRF